MLLFVGLIANSQDLSNNINSIEKRCGRLIDTQTNKKISKETLQLLLDEETFDTYKRARCQHIASIPLWTLSGISAGTSAYFFIMSNQCYNSNSDSALGFVVFTILGSAMAIGAVTYAIPAALLTIYSNNNLNEVAKDYNRKHNNLNLSFGATNNGIGLVLEF